MQTFVPNSLDVSYLLVYNNSVNISSYFIVNNLRSKLDRASVSLEDLASKGPMRCEELRGLDDLDGYVQSDDITVINGLKKMPPRTGTREVNDEHNYRTGWL